MAGQAKCTECEGIYFTEEALQRTNQSGVRIVDGETNYDDASTVDLGEVVEVVLYTCDGCGAEYKIVDGNLVPASQAA